MTQPYYKSLVTITAIDCLVILVWPGFIWAPCRNTNCRSFRNIFQHCLTSQLHPMALQFCKNSFQTTCFLAFCTADESDLTRVGDFACFLFCRCFYVESGQPISVSPEASVAERLFIYFKTACLPVCLAEGEREKLKVGEICWWNWGDLLFWGCWKDTSQNTAEHAIMWKHQLLDERALLVCSSSICLFLSLCLTLCASPHHTHTHTFLPFSPSSRPWHQLYFSNSAVLQLSRWHNTISHWLRVQK